MLMSELNLISASLALGARQVAGWSRPEQEVARRATDLDKGALRRLRQQIAEGADPLGEMFCLLRAPRERRAQGATYTPKSIVDAMVEWSACHSPVRIVDPGVGSGRFLLAAARRFPHAELLGFEVDPLAAIMARASVAAGGFASRTRIELRDYREATLPPVDGRTLFMGNPPYVRHHLLAPFWKAWLLREGRRRGLRASALAGLHVHFFLATACLARPGDYGAFVTSAEWLDVNYGALVRGLLLNGLGGRSITMLEPTVAAFSDATTTAAITTFEVATRPGAIHLRRAASLEDLRELAAGRLVASVKLAAEPRWTALMCSRRSPAAGMVELGELCRVHRGQATGCNRVWIAGEHGRELPERFLQPTVTRAKELFQAGAALLDAARLRRVIDLPADLSGLAAHEREAVERFLAALRRAGVHEGYIARHRRPWHCVGLRDPAPILATYMARRPPAFVRNLAGARQLNIAHGLYPRTPLSDAALDRLVAFLSRSASTRGGRTYAGGLTKFEPREMERLPVPNLNALVEQA
jgi:hypothetical protein